MSQRTHSPAPRRAESSDAGATAQAGAQTLTGLRSRRAKATGRPDPRSETGLRGRSRKRMHMLEAITTIGTIGVTFGLITFALAQVISPEKRHPAHELLPAAPPAPEMAPRKVEVPVGEFEYAWSTVGTSSTEVKSHLLRFDVTAVIEGPPPEVMRMESVLQAYRNRIRQRVDEAARAASPDDLNDPELKYLRTELLARINETLAEPFVHDVIITGMHFFQIPTPRADY